MKSLKTYAWRAGLVVIGLASLGEGCVSSESPAATTSAASSTGTGPQQAICAKDPRVEPYAVGLEATTKDGAFKVLFDDANPAPPSRGINTFMIQIVDGQGKPLDGATITMKPFMPDHGHGSSITPQTKPMGSDGRYEITLVDLFMPGVWQLTFNVQPLGGSSEAVVFTFCVDG